MSDAEFLFGWSEMMRVHTDRLAFSLSNFSPGKWQYLSIAMVWSNPYQKPRRIRHKFTPVVVLRHQVPQDLALGLPPNPGLLAPLISYLLRSRHVWLNSPPRTHQYV